MTPNEDQLSRAQIVYQGCYMEFPQENVTASWLAVACVLLTSPRKAEREEGKELVRKWKKAGAVSHAKRSLID